MYRRRVAELVGRDAELDAAQRFLGLLADGPAALTVVGQAGIGKTSVWSAAIGLATQRGLRVLTARPVEAELALGHAALGDLLQDVADEVIPELPGVQARALSTALSMASDPEPSDPLLVARATLTALRVLAPVVVAVDDVHWLDRSSARALAFAARRVGDVRVGFVIALRDDHADPLQVAAALGDRSVEVRLSGLSLGATGHLLRERYGQALPRRRLRSIHERSAGNPFFAIELARAPDAEEGLPQTLGDLVQRRLEVASGGRSAIELLAVRGPQSVGEFTDRVALDAAVTDGVLVERAGEVRFAHPLLAAGAYERIPPARRRALHAQAASLTDSVELRARHLALAATGSDPRVAAILDDAARSARARGAPETAAELVAHARRLTPPDDRSGRARRMIDEAEYVFDAADDASARRLVNEMLAEGVRGAVRVRALHLRALTTLDPRVAVASMEQAVAEPHDDRILRVRALAQLAWQRGAWLGDLRPAIREALEAVAKAELLGDPPMLVNALTTAGLILSLSDQPGAAEHFRRAIEVMKSATTAVGDRLPQAAFAVERWWRGEFETAQALLGDARRISEEHGNEGVLLRLDQFEADLATRRGRWDDAERLLEKVLVEAEGYWRIRTLVLRAILRAHRGDARAIEDAEAIRTSPVAATDPLMAAAADFAAGLLDFAAGRIGEAADRVSRLVETNALAGSRSAEFAATIPEVVAILVEAGRVDEAEALGRQLAGRTNQLAPWSDAAAALCLGLVAHGAGRLDEAEAHLALAQAAFTRLDAPWELAQTLLAHGSLLRRQGQRRNAGELLDRAVAIFDALSAKPYAARAREELRRARPRQRHDDALTAAETRVARLVAQGMSNREIAAKQFTSVGTVEAHLTRIYSKLGIRSRTDLARLVSGGSLSLDDDG